MDLQVDVPQVQVTVDMDRAERYGIKPGDVRRAASTLLAGEEVGDIFRGGKAYDVQVWSTPETRNSLTSIRELPIDTPRRRRSTPRRRGRHPDPGDAERHRARQRVASHRHRGKPQRRRPWIGGRRYQRGFVQPIDLPVGYHAEVLGENAERQAAQSRLLIFGGQPDS